MNTAFYVHVPFCPSWCRFCHFYINGKKQEWYVELLKKEYSLRFGDTVQQVSCIHIWWWTPNLLSEPELQELLSFLRKTLLWYKEFSIELHPALCTKKQLDILKAWWIDRISFGIQSLDSSILAHHTRVSGNYEKLHELVAYAKEIGIKKINFDFIYDLIGDSLKNIQRNFDFIETCKPSSVYYYRLRRFTEHLKKYHTSNEKRAFWYYMKVKNSFQKLWYTRLNNAVYYDRSQLWSQVPFLYDEIIYASRHNLIGIWTAATSEIENHFTKNICSYEEYQKSLSEKNVLLLDQDFSIASSARVLNRLYFFLLQRSQVELSSFTSIFWNMLELQDALNKLRDHDLVSVIDEGIFRLTEKGHYYFDEKIWDILFSDYRGEFELLKKL